jgi:hypothetical protein
MSKRTEFRNLVLVTQENLVNSENYRVQSIKERLNSAQVGVDPTGVTATSYYGIVKEPSDLKFNSGVDGSTYTSAPTFTLNSGVAYTRFNSDINQSSQYLGGERMSVVSSMPVTIKPTTTGNYYVFLVYVELQKNKQFDESGSNSYYTNQEENFLVVQMTQAQALTSLGSFGGNPTGSVVASSIAAPWLDSLLTTEEKTATFGSWSYVSGVFTITNFTVTHYNSVFLGEIIVTNSSPVNWTLRHNLQVSDPLYGIDSRPGWSTVDQFHRTQIGRGTASTTNPHALIIQDLGNFNDNNVDHNNLDHSQGIIPKFTNSCECKIDGTAGPGYDNVLITQINSGEYLFIQGKRITTLSSTTVSFSDLPATGVYYIYVQPSGSSTQINVYPWEYYSGTVSKGTTIPTDAYLLCSVYWDGSTVRAYIADPRYSAGSVVNPVTDLRVFGLTGYDVLHSTILESVNKENLIPNGSMQISEKGKIKGWVTGTSAKIVPSSGSIALQIGAGLSDTSLLFPFDANVDHAFRVKLNSEGVSSTYTVTLQLFRGKDRALDQIGTFVLKTTTATYSTWTLVESEFLSSSVITYSGALTDRNYIGWADIQITSSVALDVDDIVLRPKIKTIDISDSQVTTAKIADSNVTTAKITDDNVTSLKIPRAVKAIYKGHLDATADTTTLESLVDGGVTSLHTHPVGGQNIITSTQIIAPTGYSTASVNTPTLVAGTWMVEAFVQARPGGPSGTSYHMTINGTTVCTRSNDASYPDYLMAGAIGPIVWGGGVMIVSAFPPASSGGWAYEDILFYIRATQVG